MKKFQFLMAMVFVFHAAEALAGNHAVGVQAGPVVQMQAKVENVDSHFEYRGNMARLRYEFRHAEHRYAAGGFLQTVRVTNTYSDADFPETKETLAATGFGLHLGYLIGGNGEVDLGIGYQPAQFKKSSADENGSTTVETHTYASGLNLNFGITIAPTIGFLAIPLRLQFDMTSLSGGHASGNDDAVMRSVSLVSKSFLAGIDITY